ncbi:synaptic vesicle membrane protein VAT-1 homolog-like [Gigantopelta aegis]|uniref:synaptic vesicle membrane protein VAT-1 homolog-like n=1 Tax=Gigantopelta aegis TaxID=1735272 RepID=UPI001B888226|nr:synaptic vesicle membrane protein VAT-1 homolog-like [Gigantopelta aegis]XP_041376046.1 synaptic vesicle membrane protein VAT-1 homolog-like [Gigantopelta aegis]
MSEGTQAPTENAAETKPEGDAAAAPPQKEMKSVVLTGFGGVKMVKVLQKPEPTAKEGEVLVRVKACGVNFPDLMVRQGVMDHPPKTPVIMGFECSGIVEAVGENTTGFSVGDRVIGFTNYGAWAELAAIPSNHVFKMPDNMSFQDGAALVMNYVTAYVLLFDLANLRKGHSVLVHSVGGGVGHAITQLCKTVEDVTVFGTASSHKHDAIKANVSHLFDHSTDYAQEIRKINSEGVDIVLDCLCAEDTNRGINLIKPMGKYLLYGSSNIVTGETKSFFSFAKSWWQVDKVSPIKLFDENKMIGGFQLRRLVFNQGQHTYVRDIVNKLFALYNSAKINPTVDSVWAFEDVGEAMQKIHDRKNIGKLILDPTAQPKPKSASTEKAAEGTKENSTDKKDDAGSGGD